MSIVAMINMKECTASLFDPGTYFRAFWVFFYHYSVVVIEADHMKTGQ